MAPAHDLQLRRIRTLNYDVARAPAGVVPRDRGRSPVGPSQQRTQARYGGTEKNMILLSYQGEVQLDKSLSWHVMRAEKNWVVFFDFMSV